MVAHRIMELIVEQKLLPEGALSFLVGGAGDLVSHLGSQDVLAFTGSGETGTKLRSSRNVIEQAVRVNVEADSLNAAVLGPDVEPRSDMYDFPKSGARHDAKSRAEMHRDPPDCGS
jgi:oxepin-CoA hydrolase/3-oxo-5,6-dehydrosuberyl-CoA semialdehyde dehydrogenase